MRLYSLIVYSLLSFLIAFKPQAAPSKVEMEQLQIPRCLAAKLSQSYQLLAENAQFKIIELPAAEIDKLALLADQVRCGRFINLSHHLRTKPLEAKQRLAAKLLAKPLIKLPVKRDEPYEIKHEPEVTKALTKIDSQGIFQTVTHLSNYYNRSATKETGLAAAEWLKTQFNDLAIQYGREDTAAYFVPTGGIYQQPSLVTIIGKDNKEPALVIGAHMDTLDGYMPGAGDDASGSAIVMEMVRVLLESETKLKRPIYIIWYAAEERGLVGSQEVVGDFMIKNIPVKAVIQFDMTGYRSKDDDPTLWLFRDYTDQKLTNFVAQLIETYVKVPVAYSSCGYACSDHASWMAEGIPAAFPCETSFEDHNPYIHTSEDTMSLLNTEHMLNFTKLALAFAIELGSEA